MEDTIPDVSFEVPLIWCSSCKEKTENKVVTQTSCKGKTEDKVRVSIKALCEKCNKKKRTFYKNTDSDLENDKSTQTCESNKKIKKQSKKKLDVIEEEPRITLTLSQLASFLNAKF